MFAFRYSKRLMPLVSKVLISMYVCSYLSSHTYSSILLHHQICLSNLSHTMLYILPCTCSDKLPKWCLTALFHGCHHYDLSPVGAPPLILQLCSLEYVYNVVEDPCTAFFNVLATSGCKSLSDNHVNQSENRILTI